MEYDLLIKAVTVLIGAIGAAKLIYDLSIGKQSRMREEYKFAKEFLEDLNLNHQLHPFLREKGYHAIAGDDEISADEIKYLLSLRSPELALRDYVLGRPYLEHHPETENTQIAFKDKYRGKWSRKWRKIIYAFLYFALVILACFPLLASRFFFKDLLQMLTAIVVFGSVFGTYAWFSLRAVTRIHRAEQLVKRQNKHTQRIIFSN